MAVGTRYCSSPYNVRSDCENSPPSVCITPILRACFERSMFCAGPARLWGRSAPKARPTTLIRQCSRCCCTRTVQSLRLCRLLCASAQTWWSLICSLNPDASWKTQTSQKSVPQCSIQLECRPRKKAGQEHDRSNSPGRRCGDAARGRVETSASPFAVCSCGTGAVHRRAHHDAAPR
jgi:hypothetical protein